MINIKRILVPTDFSDSGKTALRYAVAFADQFAAAVDLLHVIEMPPPNSLMGMIPLHELCQDMTEQANAKLEELHSMWADYSFPVRKIVLEGSAFVEIVRHAKKNNTDLIIMGTHGYGAVAHMLLGSVAERTVRKASCPVMTVRSPEHEFVHPEVDLE